MSGGWGDSRNLISLKFTTLAGRSTQLDKLLISLREYFRKILWKFRSSPLSIPNNPSGRILASFLIQSHLAPTETLNENYNSDWLNDSRSSNYLPQRQRALVFAASRYTFCQCIRRENHSKFMAGTHRTCALLMWFEPNDTTTSVLISSGIPFEQSHSSFTLHSGVWREKDAKKVFRLTLGWYCSSSSVQLVRVRFGILMLVMEISGNKKITALRPCVQWHLNVETWNVWECGEMGKIPSKAYYTLTIEGFFLLPFVERKSWKLFLTLFFGRLSFEWERRGRAQKSCHLSRWIFNEIQWL